MGKRSRATQGQPNPLLQYVDGSKSEAFARSLVSLRVRIAKPMKGKGKPTHVREGLVRRAENEVSQKVKIRNILLFTRHYQLDAAIGICCHEKATACPCLDEFQGGMGIRSRRGCHILCVGCCNENARCLMAN